MFCVKLLKPLKIKDYEILLLFLLIKINKISLIRGIINLKSVLIFFNPVDQCFLNLYNQIIKVNESKKEEQK